MTRAEVESMTFLGDQRTQVLALIQERDAAEAREAVANERTAVLERQFGELTVEVQAIIAQHDELARELDEIKEGQASVVSESGALIQACRDVGVSVESRGGDGWAVSNTRAQQVEVERDCYRAGKLEWGAEFEAAVARGDVAACRADAERRHANWAKLTAERDALAAQNGALSETLQELAEAVREAAFFNEETEETIDAWHQALEAPDAAGAKWLAEHDAKVRNASPVPTLLLCPKCHQQHVDHNEWTRRPHRTHLCEHCGHKWRPFEVATYGVLTLSPGHDERLTAPLRAEIEHLGHIYEASSNQVDELKARIGQLLATAKDLGVELHYDGFGANRRADELSWKNNELTKSVAELTESTQRAHDAEMNAQSHVAMLHEAVDNWFCRRPNCSSHTALGLTDALRSARDATAPEVEAWRAEQRREVVAEVAELIRNHSCVASCCDAQPSAGEAAALADCVTRALAEKPEVKP